MDIHVSLRNGALRRRQSTSSIGTRHGAPLEARARPSVVDTVPGVVALVEHGVDALEILERAACILRAVRIDVRYLVVDYRERA